MGLGTTAGPDTTPAGDHPPGRTTTGPPAGDHRRVQPIQRRHRDTVAADGNLRSLTPWLHGPRPYLASGAAAIALAATVPTFTIIDVASRAFAAYYATQALIAAHTHHRRAAKIGYVLLAAIMLAIAALAQLAG